jgi:hypothetical protein
MKTSSAANLALARVSILLLAVGSLCMGLAAAVPAFIIGMYSASLRSGKLTDFQRSLDIRLAMVSHPSCDLS